MTFAVSRILATILGTVIPLGSLSFGVDKKQLENALAAVDANLKTTAGKQYDERTGKEFADKYLPSVKHCKQSLPSGTVIKPFDMFIKLKADGQVQEVLVYPETQFSGCTRDALLTGKFSNPPHDEYWLNVHMQIKQ